MLHVNEIDEFYEPREFILPQLGDLHGEPEMREAESAFLCGLLKKFRPKNIAEIGIAGGATSAIVLSCMKMLDIQNFKLHSIDFSKQFYRHPKYKSGFLSEVADGILFSNNAEVYHKIYLGDIACKYKTKIGELDFLILDTMHSLPGEILDFLTLLPQIKNGGVVVLHDISLNFLYFKGKNCIATNLLFSNVNAEKYINLNEYNNSWSNIGAFIVDENTRSDIMNMFLSLFITWNYVPDLNQLKAYRDEVNSVYNQEYVMIFDEAVRLNKERIEHELSHEWIFPFNEVRKGENIVLVGYGMVGKVFEIQIEKINYCKIVCIADNDVTKHNGKIISLEELLNKNFEHAVIAVASEKIANILREQLINLGIENEKIIWNDYRL